MVQPRKLSAAGRPVCGYSSRAGLACQESWLFASSPFQTSFWPEKLATAPVQVWRWVKKL